jgi:hypothetical protein
MPLLSMNVMNNDEIISFFYNWGPLSKNKKKFKKPKELDLLLRLALLWKTYTKNLKFAQLMFFEDFSTMRIKL